MVNAHQLLKWGADIVRVQDGLLGELERYAKHLPQGQTHSRHSVHSLLCECLWSTYYMPGFLLGTRKLETNKSPALTDLTISINERIAILMQTQ